MLIAAGCSAAGGGTTDTGGTQSQSTSAAASGDVYRIGYNSSQTGGLAYSDVSASMGVKMAIDEINAAGGINGKWKIELTIEDNRSDPGQSAVVAQDLLTKNIQLQICTSDADPCIAAGNIAQAANIPTISTAATSPTLPGAVGDYMFMSVFGDNTQTTVGADYATKQGYRSAYVLCSPDSSYTSKSCDYFEQVFTDKGGAIAGKGSFSLGAADFSGEVTRISNLSPRPEVIFTPAYPPDAPTFLKQLRAAGLDIPVISMDGVDSQATIDAGGAAVNGLVFTTHGFPAPGTPTADFWKAYHEKYGKDPESVFAATGYDLVKVIEAAVTKADSTDPTKVRDAMDTLKDVEGATGKITYADQNRIPLKTVYLVEIKDGKFSLLGTETPNSSEIPAP
jgi:branched-chain amino acid transport system substrate-binding protein